MKATLKYCTKSYIGDAESAEDIIAFCARVSSPKNQISNASNEKLIEYLIKHKHWSPFELFNAVIEVETTRDIARQLLRHRSFVFQEYSQRYANPLENLELITSEARLQDKLNRQNSIITDDEFLKSEWTKRQEEINTLVTEHYSWAISNGIAKESARKILPEGNTMSRLYVNGTIRSWIHYIDLRTDVETQLEHRELAYACGKELLKVFPLIERFIHNG